MDDELPIIQYATAERRRPRCDGVRLASSVGAVLSLALCVYATIYRSGELLILCLLILAVIPLAAAVVLTIEGETGERHTWVSVLATTFTAAALLGWTSILSLFILLVVGS